LMKAIEFKATISKNKISIPVDVQEQLDKSREKEIRVMLLIEEENSENEFLQLSKDQFLKGYSESDSIYDNYKVEG